MTVDDHSDTGVRTDQHICAFCQTMFDSSKRVCPSCGAEIVMRGER